MAIHLPESLAAEGSSDFSRLLKHELEAQAGLLPLQQALAGSNAVFGEQIEVMVISHQTDTNHISARVGVFYSGIVAGCSCADDPTPVEVRNEYCELLVDIDRRTAAADVRFVQD